MNNLHPKVPVGECLVKVRTCNPAVTLAGSYFDYLDIASVDRDAKKVTAATKTAAAEAPSRARQIVHAGDVLVSTVRPNLNAVARVSDEFHAAIASTGFCVLRPRSDMLDSRYLFHWAKSEGFVKDMVARATGANYPAVSDKTVKTSLIPLPPLAEQERIADTLDKADALRRKDQKLLQKYDELAQSIFNEMFGDPKHNLKGWDILPFGNLIHGIKAGTSLGGEDRELLPGEFGVLKISAVTSGVFKQEEYKVPVQSEIVKEKVTVKKDDLLFSRANTRELVGAVAIAEDSYPNLMLPDKLWRIDLDPAQLRKYYCRAILTDKNIRYHLTKTATGTSGSMLNISMGKLKDLEIPVPPIELQEEFDALSKRILVQKQLLEKSSVQSSSLFTSLLSSYFS
ncbi:restriction endonuclease subunit S [Hymenobacter sp. NST-14]|uniref:restriction endonuclease subunit S n=1 Tax=Hymenobacter piscis TaxID=2839984 RepID=UPI001C0216BD|nr:restriction endonuclease subunit S [Hymenobacter piscis]MBT9391783.1 restriction endonuclease subunit S [Hymenobacter piscis]